MARWAAAAIIVAGLALTITVATLASCAGPRTTITTRGIIYVHDPGQVTGTIPSGCHANGNLPDLACTPGGADPDVTQATLRITICVPGYTATVRPPESQTSRLKRAMYKAYGIPAATVTELDHLVPLELGGSNDTTNLWPQAGRIPNPKDTIENALNAAVCGKRLTNDLCWPRIPLLAAQQAIARNWTTAMTALGLTVQVPCA